MLIVAARNTREVDGVIDRLRSRHLDVVRFSVCQYPEFDHRTWTPSAGDRTYGQPLAAWLCDFAGWSVETNLIGLEREISIAECAAFVEGSLLALDVSWLNTPVAIARASRKLLQLKLARECGLQIPETCVTNSARDAKLFCDQHSAVVAKSLALGFVKYGGNNLKFYTRRLSAETDRLFEALRLGPLIFQQEIKKSEEIRVIVVDEEAIAVRFDFSAISEDEVDIRRLDYLEHRSRFSPCKDRPDVLSGSKKIVSALGLAYGGVDWVIDGRGVAHFLECNPLGAFKWFEMRSGEDITGSIANALEKRCGALGPINNAAKNERYAAP